MRIAARGLVICALAVGCGAGGARPPANDPGDVPHGLLADEDAYQPTYNMHELQEALIAEHAAEAAAARRISELEVRQADAADPAASSAADDQVRAAVDDLAVRRRFIATLEACEAGGRWCPPRLDDPPWSFDSDAELASEPPMTSTLRFDLGSWRSLTAELHGRACACRTMVCVDSVGVAIDQLELRPMPEVQGDDAASASVTRARECLFRLRGKSTTTARPARPADD